MPFAALCRFKSTEQTSRSPLPWSDGKFLLLRTDQEHAPPLQELHLETPSREELKEARYQWNS